ncbi:Pentapeptide repeats (9 copies) [Popillia japonica]|uniref:Pentapeptide repeats (9 copies) n=1 Tax=Popillia japonica TaxID=7064 RepID=A0AAW1JZU8_POPJA
MCEESACLVPALDTSSQNGSVEPRVSNGSVVNPPAPNNGEALVGFHEDALSQAATGKAQLILALVLGLALAADCSELTILELTILGYILPAAELQLCIDDHRKGWLVSITLLALAIGSFVWGILGDKLGRRRSLASALAVAAIFLSMAAVMPTYGTFMTARFCSGLGIAGAVPLTFSYLAETCPRATRTRYTGLLHSFWPLGALFTSILAHLILPTDGADIVSDNLEHWSSWHKILMMNNILPTDGADIVSDNLEHWSSWHKILMMNNLPIVTCMIGLIWTSESPRYLLEASREIEALEREAQEYVQECSCSTSRNVLALGIDSFREVFQRMLSPSNYQTTILLGTLHLLLGFLYMGISTFSASMIKELNNAHFRQLRRHISDVNYTGTVFNATIENVQYRDSYFINVTFKHIEFNHVEFVNCLFEDAEFSDIKSSITYFENSTIKDSRFFDTDLTEHHFINCNMINNTFIALISGCAIDFDYNIFVEDLYQETIAWAGPMLPALLVIGFMLEATTRPPEILMLLLLTSLTGIGIFFLSSFASVLVVEAIIKVFLICTLNVITIVVIEGYPCYLRCSAHGIMRCLYHLASLCAIPIFNSMVHTILLFPAIITMGLAFLAAILSMRIQDNSKVLTRYYYFPPSSRWVLHF